MQFMIKRIYLSTELVFTEAQVKSPSDLGYIIHKKLQNIHYEEPIRSIIYSTEVYTRIANDEDWKLVFNSDSSEPEDEPLKKWKVHEEL